MSIDIVVPVIMLVNHHFTCAGPLRKGFMGKYNRVSKKNVIKRIFKMDLDKKIISYKKKLFIFIEQTEHIKFLSVYELFSPAKQNGFRQGKEVFVLF